LPVGNPDRRALDDLGRDLRGVGFDVELAGRCRRGAFDTRRGQFGLALSLRAERVLAVTDVDLYANFVLGPEHAALGQRPRRPLFTDVGESAIICTDKPIRGIRDRRK